MSEREKPSRDLARAVVSARGHGIWGKRLANGAGRHRLALGSRERRFVFEGRLDGRRGASGSGYGVEDPPGDVVVGDDGADLEAAAAASADLDVNLEGTREQRG